MPRTVDPTPVKQFLTVRQLASRYSVNTSTIWRWSRDGEFPQPVQFSNKCTRWRLSEVEAHEAQLPSVQTDAA